MSYFSSLLFLFCLVCPVFCIADTVVWHGKVDSNGDPTELIKLEIGKKYQIKVSGTVNLGKWIQAGEPLTQDACYEENPKVKPSPLSTFRNSLNIKVCQSGYRPDHVYLSAPFVATDNGFHFWIQDTDYTDNNGALQVEVIKVDDSSK